MNTLNNIKKKSLVKFPIPNRRNFMNDEEMLEYFIKGITYYDAHLGIDYIPKKKSLPISKYTSNGYCYIFLSGLNIDDKSEYFEEYRKILLKAKSDKYRKFILSFYTAIPIESNGKTDCITEMLIPFYSDSVIYYYPSKFTNQKPDNYSIKQIYAGTNLMRYMSNGRIIHSIIDDKMKFKIPYDSLIIKTNNICYDYLLPFYNNPRVKIFYLIGNVTGRKIIVFNIKIGEKKTAVYVKLKPHFFEESKYKVFQTKQFPAKYSPNA